jgi:hypothetical protein
MKRMKKERIIDKNINDKDKNEAGKKKGGKGVLPDAFGLKGLNNFVV